MAEKAFEFPILAEISVAILRINRPKSDKPCDSDSRPIKIRVKVFSHSFTPTPPFFKSWLRACFHQGVLFSLSPATLYAVFAHNFQQLMK